MENLFSTLSTNTANTTNASKPIMGCPQNSQFSSMYGPFSYPATPSNSLTQSNYYQPQYRMPPPSESLQFPDTRSQEQPSHYSPSADPSYPFLQRQNGIEMQRPNLLQPNGLYFEQERRVLDAYRTKVARSKRRLARQRSLNKISSGANSTQIMDARRLALNGASSTGGQTSKNTTSKDFYKFITPDNKRLRVLLRKDLKNSDVGSLGRIVLPKREVEENLPVLSDKEGILVVLRDINSNQEWSLKFKFWSNNKSRMYVLENTGEFVKQNGLELGDSLTLYEDESKNLYFSITKVERAASEPSHNQQPSNRNHNHNHNHLYAPQMCQARDEEESSLAILIKQLDNTDQQEEAISLTTLPMDFINTYIQPAGAAMQPSSPPGGKMRVGDDHHVDDCYTGLDMLPDVYRYNFSL